MWGLQHYSVHAFDMSTIIVFVYLGLQVKWNQFSSNNSYHTSCIHKGSHAGKWPDLMTSKPDSVSTLGYHWTDHTGRPLEPQVHWDATGTTLADLNAQWCSSGGPVLICIIGTHWKTTEATSALGCHCYHTVWWYHGKATGRPLEDHWLSTMLYPVVFQCTLGSKFQIHWITTGLQLEDYWLRVRGGFHVRAISQEMTQSLITKICLKITFIQISQEPVSWYLFHTVWFVAKLLREIRHGKTLIVHSW